MRRSLILPIQILNEFYHSKYHAESYFSINANYKIRILIFPNVKPNLGPKLQSQNADHYQNADQ